MPPISPDTVAALRDALADFLLALEDPAAGRRVFDAYAPDAPIYAQLQLRAARELDREDFHFLHGAGYRMHEREHPDAPRRPAFEGLAATTAEAADGDRVVAWYTANERHDGRPLHLAVGWQLHAGAWRIDWLTLAEAPRPWRWADGRMQTTADFVYGEAALMVAPRSWLDVAWYRLYGRPEPAITTLPDERFTCQMSTSCCHNGFAIDVPAPMQQVIDAIDWAAHGRPDLAGVQLPVLEDGSLQVRDKGERCRYLNEHGHCLVHQVAGRQLFPACAVYPLQFRPTPDGVAVTASMTCGSARGNLGEPLASRAAEIWSRMAIAPVEEVPDTFRLRPGSSVPWPAFKAAEADLLALLARDDLPVARRLWLGERYLRCLGDGVPFDADAEAARPPVVASPPERARWRAFVHEYASRFGLTIPTPPPPLAVEHDFPQQEVILRLLRGLLFEKGYAFAQDLTTAHHVLVFLFALVVYFQGCFPGRRLPDQLLWALPGVFRHQSVYSAFAKDDEERRMLLTTLGDPDFGLDLLAAFDQLACDPAMAGVSAED